MIFRCSWHLNLLGFVYRRWVSLPTTCFDELFGSTRTVASFQEQCLIHRLKESSPRPFLENDGSKSFILLYLTGNTTIEDRKSFQSRLNPNLELTGDGSKCRVQFWEVLDHKEGWRNGASDLNFSIIFVYRHSSCRITQGAVGKHRPYYYLVLNY